jgi:hypothetical protein
MTSAAAASACNAAPIRTAAGSTRPAAPAAIAGGPTRSAAARTGPAPAGNTAAPPASAASAAASSTAPKREPSAAPTASAPRRPSSAARTKTARPTRIGAAARSRTERRVAASVAKTSIARRGSGALRPGSAITAIPVSLPAPTAPLPTASAAVAYASPPPRGRSLESVRERHRADGNETTAKVRFRREPAFAELRGATLPIRRRSRILNAPQTVSLLRLPRPHHPSREGVASRAPRAPVRSLRGKWSGWRAGDHRPRVQERIRRCAQSAQTATGRRRPPASPAAPCCGGSERWPRPGSAVTADGWPARR